MTGISGALLRYRVMAYTVGVALAVLVFIGMPLRYWFGHPFLAKDLGALHGILYIVYLAAALDMARRCRFTLLQMAAMVGAGLVPLLAFVIEHIVTARVHSRFPETVASRPSSLGA